MNEMMAATFGLVLLDSSYRILGWLRDRDLDWSRACRFRPRGQRSQLAMVPQLGFRPTPAQTLNPLLDDTTIVQILLETPAGIAQADAIAALDGWRSAPTT